MKYWNRNSRVHSLGIEDNFTDIWTLSITHSDSPLLAQPLSMQFCCADLDISTMTFIPKTLCYAFDVFLWIRLWKFDRQKLEADHIRYWQTLLENVSVVCVWRDGPVPVVLSVRQAGMHEMKNMVEKISRRDCSTAATESWRGQLELLRWFALIWPLTSPLTPALWADERFFTSGAIPPPPLVDNTVLFIHSPPRGSVHSLIQPMNPWLYQFVLLHGCCPRFCILELRLESRRLTLHHKNYSGSTLSFTSLCSSFCMPRDRAAAPSAWKETSLQQIPSGQF